MPHTLVRRPENSLALCCSTLTSCPFWYLETHSRAQLPKVTTTKVAFRGLPVTEWTTERRTICKTRKPCNRSFVGPQDRSHFWRTNENDQTLFDAGPVGRERVGHWRKGVREADRDYRDQEPGRLGNERDAFNHSGFMDG